MILTLLIPLLAMFTAAHVESILRTNYGYSIETIKPQVYFSTDDNRIVLYYTSIKCVSFFHAFSIFNYAIGD